MSIKIVGAREAVVGLRKIDPELRKQFNRDVKSIVQPVIADMKQSYPMMPLSGMKRQWNVGGRFNAFPYDQRRAQKGVKYKIDTKRSAVSLIRIQQTDPGTVIFETIGKRGSSPFSRRLSAFSGPAVRVSWPAWERNRGKVSSELEQVVLAATRTVQKELGR